MMKARQKNVRKVIAIALILVAIYLLTGVVTQVYQTIKLEKEKEKIRQELEILKEENTKLLANKKKFEDPNYIVTYAHGAYMFSKEDESVFYLPSTSADTSSDTPAPEVSSQPETTDKIEEEKSEETPQPENSEDNQTQESEKKDEE